MKEHRILAWCDLCNDEGEYTEATHQDVAVALGGHDLQADLCDRHEKELLGPLRAFLADHARPAPASRRHGKESELEAWTCPLPHCGETMLRRSAVTHMRGKHLPGFVLPSGACPECGKDAFLSAQGLAGHRTKSHGISPLDEAVKLAMEAQARPKRPAKRS